MGAGKCRAFTGAAAELIPQRAFAWLRQIVNIGLGKSDER